MSTILLNHLFVVIGPIAYKALLHSALLPQLACIEEKTVTAEGLGQWRGIYIRGKDTYLEFFDSFQGKTVGDIGIGLGVNTPDDLERLHESCVAEAPESIASRGNFKLPQDQWPLFTYIEWKTLTDALSLQQVDTFAISYTEDTFKQRITQGFQENDLSRARYNSIAWDPTKYLENITAITIRVSSEIMPELTHVLLKAGMHQEAEGRFCGQDFVLSCIPQEVSMTSDKEQKTILCSFRMRLNSSLSSPLNEEFEGGTLHLEDDWAELTIYQNKNN